MTIYEKLLAVQKEITPIKKTETNPFFNSKYFDVNAILAQLKPILSKHGLVVSQPLSSLNGKSELQTVVVDAESGDKIVSGIYLPENLDPQKMGSAITYYRRYALQALFALEAEDDDANNASGKWQGAKATTPEQYGYKPKKDPKHKDVGKDSAEHDAGNEQDL